LLKRESQSGQPKVVFLVTYVNQKTNKENTIWFSKGGLNSMSDKIYTINSPVSGTFYSRPSPEDPKYVNEGDKIQAGIVVCIVESMKVFIEVRAERGGIVKKVLIEDEDPVAPNQAMIELELI